MAIKYRGTNTGQLQISASAADVGKLLSVDSDGNLVLTSPGDGLPEGSDGISYRDEDGDVITLELPSASSRLVLVYDPVTGTLQWSDVFSELRRVLENIYILSINERMKLELEEGIRLVE